MILFYTRTTVRTCTSDTQIYCYTYRFHWYMDITLHGLLHFILAWSSYTFMFTLVTHACMDSLFLSYGSPFMLHVLLLYSWHMDPRACYMYYYSMLLDSCYTIVSYYGYGYSWYWTCERLICDMWESHISCSRFPVYYSWYLVHDILFMWYCSRFPLHGAMLSTELRSNYHVTRIMYSSCSCYIVYLT